MRMMQQHFKEMIVLTKNAAPAFRQNNKVKFINKTFSLEHFH
jgi:hypothetical protein